MPRVLVLTSYDHVFSYGIARMLRNERSIELVRRNVNNELLLQKMIRELSPIAIIVDHGLFLEHATFFCKSMRLLPGLRILVLSERENVIHVLEEKTVPIRTGDDLIKQIVSDTTRGVDLINP